MKRKLLLLASATAALCASADLPVKLVNNSRGQYSDAEIYVAIIGNREGNIYYYDLRATSDQGRCVTHPLTVAQNTLTREGHDWGFANVFVKMSDLKDHTIYLGDTPACRMFFSFKSPMFLHVHDTGGYAGADMNNPSDPNADVRWELVEFTYQPNSADNNGEIWINTTRVDAFQYPMGLELWSQGGMNGSTPYIKRGEKVTYETIIDRWNSSLGSTVYKDCYSTPITFDNVGGIIKQPSKVESIKSASIFDGYINKVWDYFRSNTANISMGVLGRWEGSVNGDAFVLTCKEGTYWKVGTTATVGKPKTEDAIEGAGAFATGSDPDKTVQAMFCAAFNRGMIRTTSGLQNWNPDVVTPFNGGSEFPCNEYVKFFHNKDITTSGGRTYAFAYDDTFEQSATCYSVAPTKATVTIGGFVNLPQADSDDDTDPAPVDISAAPKPDKAADKVMSIYSGAYQSIVPEMFVGSWNQATQAQAKDCSGDEAYKLSNFDYLGFQLVPGDGTVDVSSMKNIHIDLYSSTDMSVNFYPIQLNPTNDTQKKTLNLKAGEWNQFDMPMSDFAGLDFSKLGQFKFDGGNGQTFYFDNLYFWTDEIEDPDPQPDEIPAAPWPAHSQSNVMSIFSDAYSTIAGNMVVGRWGQQTADSKVYLQGDETFLFDNFDYFGLQMSPTDDRVNVSGMKNFHIDIYALSAVNINFHPISFGDGANNKVENNMVVLQVPARQWTSFDFPFSYFPDVDFSNLAQLKFEDAARTQVRAKADAQKAPSSKAIYVDNIYTWTDSSTTSIDSITGDEDSDIDAPIYDITGRIVGHGDISKASLPAGLYITKGKKVAVTR